MTLLISKSDFLAYVAVQRSGFTNMFAVNAVCDLSGLSREQVFACMKNYSALAEAYLPKEENV